MSPVLIASTLGSHQQHPVIHNTQCTLLSLIYRESPDMYAASAVLSVYGVYYGGRPH